MSDEPRVRFIEHAGKQILFHDLSNILNPADALPIFALSRSIVASQPFRSLLTLSDFSQSRFSTENVAALTDLAKHNKPFVKHAAFVGIHGLQRVIYVTVSQLSGRRVPIFDTLDIAKDWLVAQP